MERRSQASSPRYAPHETTALTTRPVRRGPGTGRRQSDLGGAGDPYGRARARTSLAEALASTGDHDQARQVAETITDPDRRARARTSVAVALAGGGQLGGARSALAMAWLTGSWLSSAGALAVCDPEVLRELSRDEFEN